MMNTLVMQRLTLLILVSLFFKVDLPAQDPQNILLPENLLVQDAVFIKDTTWFPNPWISYPLVYNYENAPGRDVLHLLTGPVLNGTLEALDPERDEFYPYSALENPKPIDLPRYESGQSSGADEKVKIDYARQAVGISFLENWTFDIANMHFEKEVLGFEIIRKYSMYGMDVYNPAFRVLYSAGDQWSEKGMVPVGQLEYEFLLAPVPFYRHLPNEEDMIEKGTSGYFDIPVSNYYGNNDRHAPLLTGYTKKMLIKTILDKVSDGEIKARDYYGGDLLSKDEINRRICEIDTLTAREPVANGRRDSIVLQRHDLSEFNSVIFMEDWFIHPRSVRILKKVKALALVRGYLKETDKYLETFDPRDMEWKKEIVFRIDLQNKNGH